MLISMKSLYQTTFLSGSYPSAAQPTERADSLQPDTEAAPQPALLVPAPGALGCPLEVFQEAHQGAFFNHQCRVTRVS